FGLEVTARGLLNGNTVVTQKATVRFRPGEAREFTLFLSSDCIAAGCSTDMVCVAGPRCVAESSVAQEHAYVPGGGRDGAVDQGHARAAAPPEARADGPVEAAGGDAPVEAGGADAPPAGGAPEARPNPGTWVPVPGVPTGVTLSAVWPFAD